MARMMIRRSLHKKTTIAVLAGCAIFTLTLYIVAYGVASYCKVKIDSKEDFRKPCDADMYPREMDLPEPHTEAMNRENDERQFFELIMSNSSDAKNGRISNMESQVKKEVGLRKDSSLLHLTDHHVVKRMKYEEDVLSNVSFSDLMQVIEINGINKSSFHYWTNAFISKRHKNAFRMPQLNAKGANVCNNDTELLILMPAIPNHTFIRELIRHTWASSLYGANIPSMRPISLRTKIVFIFGVKELSGNRKTALKREALRYKDVVTANFVDSYRNLSLKMMVGLKWASTFCKNAKYVMKADLDTFVNLPLLSRFLTEISEKIPRFILGHRHTWPKHPVVRSGKWQVRKEDYPFESFPPYLLGHSYVITGDLVPLLVKAGSHLPLIPPEDALITGVLARVVNAPRLHYEGFASVFKKVISCNIVHNYEISVTKMTVSRLVLIWRDVQTNMCSKTEMPSNTDTVEETELESVEKEHQDRGGQNKQDTEHGDDKGKEELGKVETGHDKKENITLKSWDSERKLHR